MTPIETAELEQRLADLRDRHAATEAAIADADAALVPAEAKLTTAQSVYDEARAELVRAVASASSGDPSAPWTPKSSGDLARDSERVRGAEAVLSEARLQLEPALVARNGIAMHRSDLLMHGRRIEDLIAEAERDLERARQAAEPERDLLGSIRARLFGDGAA